MSCNDVLTGVSFSRAHQVAGIAISFRGGRVICADVVRSSSLLDAHLLAVLREVEITAQPFGHPVRILTDRSDLLPCLSGECPAPDRATTQLLDDLRAALEDAGDKIELLSVERTHTKAAFILARQTRKAWEAGLGKRTTWEPSSASELAEAA